MIMRWRIGNDCMHYAVTDSHIMKWKVIFRRYLIVVELKRTQFHIM
jgi:hypothetical protein